MRILAMLQYSSFQVSMVVHYYLGLCVEFERSWTIQHSWWSRKINPSQILSNDRLQVQKNCRPFHALKCIKFFLTISLGLRNLINFSYFGQFYSGLIENMNSEECQQWYNHKKNQNWINMVTESIARQDNRVVLL